MNSDGGSNDTLHNGEWRDHLTSRQQYPFLLQRDIVVRNLRYEGHFHPNSLGSLRHSNRSPPDTDEAP